ncbi:MAG: hypothetical protein ACK5IA_03925, partial [Cyanobacteriota bacterium]
GVKLRLGPSHWLMLRFSGTEPLLRLYGEAPTAGRVVEVLGWARPLADSDGPTATPPGPPSPPW